MEPRTQKLQFRVTELERQIVDAAAEASAMNLTSYLRNSVVTRAKADILTKGRGGRMLQRHYEATGEGTG